MASFVIADDGTIPRDVLRQILQTAGHLVLGAAANGALALDLVRALRPEAVIFDIIMPVMTGSEAATIVSDQQLARWIGVATLSTQAQIVAPLEKRGIFVLAKPFRSEQLISALDRIGIPRPRKP